VLSTPQDDNENHHRTQKEKPSALSEHSAQGDRAPEPHQRHPTGFSAKGTTGLCGLTSLADDARVVEVHVTAGPGPAPHGNDANVPSARARVQTAAIQGECHPLPRHVLHLLVHPRPAAGGSPSGANEQPLIPVATRRHTAEDPYLSNSSPVDLYNPLISDRPAPATLCSHKQKIPHRHQPTSFPEHRGREGHRHQGLEDGDDEHSRWDGYEFE
jgi:hypothetical protein